MMSNYTDTGYYIVEDSMHIYQQVFSNPYLEPLQNMVSCFASSQWAEPSLTPKLMYEALQQAYDDNEIDFEMSKTEAEGLIRDYITLLENNDATPEWNEGKGEADFIIQPFLEFMKILKDAPEDANYLFWFLCRLFFLTVGINIEISPLVLKDAKLYDELHLHSNEKKEYKDLVNEYKDLQATPDEDVMKTVDPVDVSYLPEYIIDNLYKWNGKYYSYDSINKAMTAAGSVASALQTQDLEPNMTGAAELEDEEHLTGEQIGLNYIKKLKLRREKNASKP
jgi:hypothetical protein